MKRCIVQFRDGSHANLEADTLRTHPDDANIILATKGPNLIGVFDLSVVMKIYLSEKREDPKKQA